MNSPWYRGCSWIMEVFKCVLVLVTLSAVCAVDLRRTTTTTKAPDIDCSPEKLTVYRVILHTYWTRDKFPKHFPDWKPPAQWSKLIGRSHNTTYILYRIGQLANPAVKSFAETGKTEALDEQSQGGDGIFDEFSAPAITSGSGRTETEFFVDGNHSHVSIVSRLVPSPDWFIGLDSFNLCVDGNWVDSVTVEVDPLDAGTNNGFTFTAPNWPTDPPGTIYKITSKYPSHRAGSFYYPYMKRLPAIATFQFIKIKEYELSEVFHHSQDKANSEVMKIDQLAKNDMKEVSKNNDIEEQIEEERKEEEIRAFKTTLETTQDPNSIAKTSPNAFLSTEGEKSAVIKHIFQRYKNKDRYKYDMLGKETSKKLRSPRDCKVSEWGEWSTCSKTCNIGQVERRREIIKRQRRGGAKCPPLLETRWCGSIKDCPKEDSFNW